MARSPLFLAAACSALIAGSAQADSPMLPSQSLAAGERSLAITLYNQDLAFFHELRDAELQRGPNRLALEGVASTVMPQSLYLEATGVALLSQSYQPATLSRGSLAEAFLGESVGVLLPSEEQVDRLERHEGRLVSLSGGPLFEVGGDLRLVPLEHLLFPRTPAELRGEDALLIDLLSEEGGETRLDIGYLATGFSWQADYTARYDETAGTLSVVAQASLSNNTPESYRGAAISLVAGEINRAHSGVPLEAMRGDVMMMSEAAAAPMPKQEAAGDYYRYVLPGRVDLPSQSLKQVTFLEAADVPVERNYRIEGLIMQGGNRGQVAGPVNATTRLIFDNSEETGLGRPLPAGTWRVYGESAEGGRLLLGEAGEGHTPKDGELELVLGRSFDVRGEAKVTDFKRLSNRSYELSQEVTVTNAKDEAVTVELVGVFPPDLRVLSTSLEVESEAAGQLVWTLPVPAEGEASFGFRILVNY